MYLPDYYIFPDPIDTNSHIRIYRSVRCQDQVPVLLKCLQPASQSVDELTRLYNVLHDEYILTQMLDHPSIIRSIDFVCKAEQAVLILENNGSLPIEDYCFEVSSHYSYRIGQGTPMPPSFFWSLALQTIEIVAVLANHQILIPDLSGRHLWIHPQTQKLTLMNLDSTRPLTPDRPEALQGVGQLFYEWLTGLRWDEVAQQRTLLDWFHGNVPLMLSRVVMKLLDPSPVARYHSVQALWADLSRCASEWQTQGQITEFQLGTAERPEYFNIADRLYGRDAEIDQISAMATQLVQNPEKLLLLVSGPSGIGKTSIVEQFQIPLIALEKGRLIRGKYDPSNQHLPLSAIFQAFRDLIRQWLEEPKPKQLIRKKNLREALNWEGDVLVNVLPELIQIIGPQPEVVKLTGVEARKRFNRVLSAFIREIVSQDMPLILFLDDVHWADGASLNLIHQWMQDDCLCHFFCVLAYRDQALPPNHVLHKLITFFEGQDDSGQSNIILQRMTIGALSPTALNQMIADTLRCCEPQSQPLSEEIWSRTKGNPLFSIQMLTAFYQDRYLFFNTEENCWECDFSQIQSSQISEDIVDFIIERLARLTVSTRNLLSLAACLGDYFDLSTLSIIAEQSELTIAAKLWRSLQEGLVIPASQIYRFYPIKSEPSSNPDLNHLSLSTVKVGGIALNTVSQNLLSLHHGEAMFGNVFGSVFETETYRFLHDRVQQAAYALIPLDHKPQTHLRIGRLLEAKFRSALTEGTLPDRELFILVNQFNQGLMALEDPEEKIAIAELNLIASQRAMVTAAYQSALDYVTLGLALVPLDAWDSQDALLRSLTNLAAESAYCVTTLAQSSESSDRFPQQPQLQQPQQPQLQQPQQKGSDLSNSNRCPDSVTALS